MNSLQYAFYLANYSCFMAWHFNSNSFYHLLEVSSRSRAWYFRSLEGDQMGELLHSEA